MNPKKSKIISGSSGASRRSKGQASRETILRTAAQLATTKGLEGLSIGDLAAAVGMSKSGLYAHFKSKEELELATIQMATTIFEREVLQPALRVKAGLPRLFALCDAFLSHLQRRVFYGGCFFASMAAELDTRPGTARDQVVQMQEKWLGLLHQCLVDAQTAGTISGEADVAQAVFETEAMLMAANFLFILTNDPTRLAQARAGVEHIVSRLDDSTCASSPSRR